MDKTTLKQRIATLLQGGHSLAEIQNLLRREDGETITFLDLRLLAAEVEGVDWGETTADQHRRQELDPADGDLATTEPAGVDSGTVVEISKLARPGAALSGSVRFTSGVTADWVLDAHGRLGLENAKGQPSPEDIQDFQQELQRKISGGSV